MRSCHQLIWLVALLLLQLYTLEAQAQGCSPLAVPSNGSITYDQSETVIDGQQLYPFLTTATYSINCDRTQSFVLNGPTTRMCTFTEMWDGTDPFCQVDTCPVLQLRNGEIRHNNLTQHPDGGYSENTTASYGCDIGFGLTGNSNSICSGVIVNSVLRSVRWEPIVPQCSPQCPLIDTSLAAVRVSGFFRVSYSPNNRFVGATATHTCLPGYVAALGISLERQCVNNTNGVSWSLPPVTCEPICTDLEPIVNVSIRYLPTGAPRRLGTNATYSCDFGFQLIGGNQIRICDRVERETFDIADWSGEAPRCERPVCPEIEPGVGIASISYSDPDRIIGSIANHTCLPNFLPDDDLVRTCSRSSDNVSAEWDLPEETCYPFCEELPPLGNGSISYDPDQQPREVGTVANYTCNDDFKYVQGDESRPCSEIIANGDLIGADWDGIAGRCERQCSPLLDLENGRREYSLVGDPDFDVGTIATHICNDGYALIGQ